MELSKLLLWCRWLEFEDFPRLDYLNKISFIQILNFRLQEKYALVAQTQRYPWIGLFQSNFIHFYYEKKQSKVLFVEKMAFVSAKSCTA